jgi:hypothetical protein
MVEEALRDPVSVAMLKTNGAQIMEVSGEKPSRRIGWVLHALLEEVLDEPSKNTEAYLDARTRELLALPEKELETLGETGKRRKAEEDALEIEALRKKYRVT